MLSEKQIWKTLLNMPGLECKNVAINKASNELGTLCLLMSVINGTEIPVLADDVKISLAGQWYCVQFNAEGAGHCTVLTHKVRLESLGELPEV